MGAAEMDMLLILYVIGIAQVTSRRGVVGSGHCFNSYSTVYGPGLDT